MRISDWSSDVCSSDLAAAALLALTIALLLLLLLAILLALLTLFVLVLTWHRCLLRSCSQGGAGTDERTRRAEQWYPRSIASGCRSGDGLSRRFAPRRLRERACPPEVGRASCRERVCQYV